MKNRDKEIEQLVDTMLKITTIDGRYYNEVERQGYFFTQKRNMVLVHKFIDFDFSKRTGMLLLRTEDDIFQIDSVFLFYAHALNNAMKYEGIQKR